MRAVVQRVSSARVDIAGETVGEIERGLLILLGVGHDDTDDQVERLWSKISRLRIFEDADGKTNLSLADVGGEVLVVSQFTLFANCRRGNRPSFTEAGESPVRAVRRTGAPRCAPRGDGTLRRLHGREPGQRRPVHAVARYRRAVAHPQRALARLR